MVAGSNKVVPGYGGVVVGRDAQRPIHPAVLEKAGQPHVCIVDGKKLELSIAIFQLFGIYQFS